MVGMDVAKGRELELLAASWGLRRKRNRLWFLTIKESDESLRRRVHAHVMGRPDTAAGYEPRRAGWWRRWWPLFVCCVFAVLVSTIVRAYTDSAFTAVAIAFGIAFTMPAEWLPHNRKWIE